MGREHQCAIVSRRAFLGTAAAAAGAVATGCAVNPVTGDRQIMLVSRAQELSLDRKWAPHQFSADYGPSQDLGLNAYVARVGSGLVTACHRRDMPYSFRVLNAVHVNGYTFPAGSIGLARGLMLMMEDEAQLAAVLGHELAHVNHRHAGDRMTKSMLATAAVGLAAAYVQKEKEKYAPVAAGLGMVGANLLLSRYSRDNEREADATGMDYMVSGGHNPRGMVGLMDGFRKLHKSKPDLVQVLFSTHPMSDERYGTAQRMVRDRYVQALDRDLGRERYMDHMAGLRRKADGIRKFQEGQETLMKQQPAQAQSLLVEGLRLAPGDYAGLLLLAKTHLVQEHYAEAAQRADEARRIYPGEAQACHVSGLAKIRLKQYGAAQAELDAYDRLLPGNSNTLFYRGYCLEMTERRKQAAELYKKYLAEAPKGEHAQHAHTRLVEWGYLEIPAAQPKAGAT